MMLGLCPIRATQVLLRTGSIAPTNERWLYEGLRRRDGGLFYEAGIAAYPRGLGVLVDWVEIRPLRPGAPGS